MFNKIIKRVNHKNIMAVIFLLYIFYLACVNLPVFHGSLDAQVKEDQFSLTSFRNDLDKQYKQILEFEGNYLQNKGAYINLNGLMANLMGQRLMNQRVKLNDGHLTYLVSEMDFVPAEIQIKKLYERQTKEGKGFLFVMAPFKISKYDSQLPVGFTDYSNQLADSLLELLDTEGIPYLDLRESMYEQGISHTDAFYITDHHWKYDTAFWGFGQVMDKLQDFDIILEDTKYTDINYYNTEFYEKWFLGTNGKRTGSYYAGVDDFSIIYPGFDTHLSVDIPTRNYNNSGTFEEVVINRKKMVKDYFNSDPYAAYGMHYGVDKYYRNENAPIDKKVLAIGDSFSHVAFSFLPLCFTACDQLDMRYYDGNFNEYYESFSPDMVIFLINPSGVITDNTTFDFFSDN